MALPRREIYHLSLLSCFERQEMDSRSKIDNHHLVQQSRAMRMIRRQNARVCVGVYVRWCTIAGTYTYANDALVHVIYTSGTIRVAHTSGAA